jgi:hypothetical protein
MAWKTAIIRPCGDTNTLQWTPYPTSPTTHYDKVDENLPDDDATYVWTSLNNYKDAFSMQDLMDGSGEIPENRNIEIASVTWYYRARSTNSIPISQPSITCVPWNWEYSSLFSIPRLTTSWVTIHHTLTTLGTFGNERPITIDDIDMVELRINSSIRGKDTIRCTQIYMEVVWDYLPEAPQGSAIFFSYNT